MLLFPQKDDKSAVKEKVFFVCSVRESVSTRLSEMLRMAGFSHVENIAQDLLQNSQISFLANASGVIIDIGHSVDPQEVIAKVQATIPRNVWCCVVGDSDSIALAQSFSRQGIFYFNVNVQAEELIVAATTGMSASSPRGTACVSVLGCKGGVGNTQIAWQLAQQIVQRRSMPTLFIQGLAGSRDLDIFVGKKLLQDIVQVNKNLDAKQQDSENLPDFKNSAYDKYNFVVFEETINSASKETLRHLVEKSTCLILVLDRSMSSVRIAHTVMEMIEALNRSQPTPRRLILCLSDCRPVTFEMLSIEDLQSLLERRLDIVFPYQKSRSFAAFTIRKQVAPIDLLAQRVLGASTQTTSKFMRRLSHKPER
ncbi:TPA: tight adherance operon protein [Enterobacter soli]|nr:tight adherance operon protein [Enterobacter soli]